MAHHYQVFETATGFAAIGWGTGGVTSFRLPAPTAREAGQALLRRLPDARRAEPPPGMCEVIDMACRCFTGERVDFAAVPVDLGPQGDFFTRVYAHVRALGWGEVTTYGAVARALDAAPEAARAVGQAMASNPVPLIIPCHRVRAANGRIGGFSAPGGSLSKVHMLTLEGVERASVEATAQMGFGF
ncbi:methylated-DNA--[protein]-cysteine S-methyltransferase [Altererythrobacter xixiisoli]|uniref:Methylated-DNA--[protein]-cysteine S-methyltransferase n=1 Tax=Croceibacterium xixiisoli TaxID=1476466 RepID=A0A6I4TQY3_9SPHN|nr:methylated-DNA--[protein]-cysteine S-methyltransferase [Croceibacterium xixiisoli]MXO97521.1 methylated-DNA--[protein]-cysteine S-methyltransferase [Croceibacterium xixiisoli]